MQSVEPVLENAIKTLQKVVDVRGMGKALVQLEDNTMVMLGDDGVAGEPTKDAEPIAVAKAESTAKAAREADAVVAKQEAAMAKANAAALENSVESPVDPKLLKKNAEKAAKEEEKALKDKEKAAEEEEKASKKLIEEGTKALKTLQTDEEKKAPGTTKPAAPLDRDGKPIKCKPVEDKKEEDDKKKK